MSFTSNYGLRLKLGYNTNGFAGISLSEAIRQLSAIGYEGIAISLDHDVLNPFAPGLNDEISMVKDLLGEYRMAAVIETGARYLLDSNIKHEPTLMSPTSRERARRIEFLRHAVDIAERLEAECVSLWSGRLRDQAGESEAVDRLANGLQAVLEYAAERGVVVAFEPEPDMFIDTMARYRRLLEALEQRGADLSHLRLTIDIGHLHCQAEVPIADFIKAWADHVVNVHIEDMRAGVHEHLMFGEGEIDFPPVIAALADIGYTKPINVELSRHAAEGLAAARRSYDFLRPLIERSLPR